MLIQAPNMNLKSLRASKCAHVIFSLIVIFLFLYGAKVQARTYSFWIECEACLPAVIYQRPSDGCDHIYNVTFPYLLSYYRPEKSFYDPDFKYKRFQCGADLNVGYFGSVTLQTITCDDSELLDFTNLRCKKIGSKGRQVGQEMCSATQKAPSSFIGNPVNLTSGNKYQQELDLLVNKETGVYLFRTYNSVNGVWAHNYSSHLDFPEDGVVVAESDGGDSFFKKGKSEYKSESNIGALNYVDATEQWIYKSADLSSYYFDKQGRLLKIVNPKGNVLSLSYSWISQNKNILITDTYGHQLNIVEDAKRQPLAAYSKNSRVDYTYNSFWMLIKVVKAIDGIESVRTYSYDDPNSKAFLTSITDERGIVYATWTYDSLGRALSSEHAGGAEKMTISYNDNMTTVVNELGKKAIYRFKDIKNVARITSIEGQPSPGCPASDSSYSYNDLGQLLTKIDAKGSITTYTYNDRGLETTRTEASGTPQARVTTTEWDPTRFLRTKVVEPTRTTVYTYDDQGRETGRQVSAR